MNARGLGDRLRKAPVDEVWNGADHDDDFEGNAAFTCFRGPDHDRHLACIVLERHGAAIEVRAFHANGNDGQEYDRVVATVTATFSKVYAAIENATGYHDWPEMPLQLVALLFIARGW